ncbi:MAG: prepilin-type N-terminal cleavage/methylation domain-containing protein [Gemmatimonadaceae bacterium]|nr:prepilin-type N-terminal cleavage/methylation domain-containing protein [Gemmatimonadaceae bacterium]
MLRRGFTLVEVMIALLVGSMVVLLAYATLRAGLDVQDRVTSAREADETSTAMRAMLADALRHAVTADAGASRGLESEADATGRPARLGFISRGITAPLGGSAPWQVDLTADTMGVTLDASPLDGAGGALRFTSRTSRAFAVRFLARDDDQWRADWNDPTRLPSAIEVRFLDGAGHESMSPLVARTAPVSGL